MRAAIARGGRIVVDDLPEPEPTEGQVLVRSLACGICGSDLHALHHGHSLVSLSRRAGAGFDYDPDADVVFGHEFCAEVLDYGPGTDSRLPAGTKVVSVPRVPDAGGAHVVGYSNQYPGACAERFLLGAEHLLAVPNGLSAQHAALTEPMAVGAHAGRGLRTWTDTNRGVAVVTVELPVDQAEIVLNAVDRAVERGRCEAGPEFGEVSWSAQRADALVSVASDYLSGGDTAGSSNVDRYQVVVHVDGAALDAGRGRSDLPLETVERLLCDGSVVEVVDGPHGEPLDIGRKRRTVSTALRRALWARDRGCSFPGCTNRHFVDAHHVRPWSQGGQTSLTNTCLLCSHHHIVGHGCLHRHFMAPESVAP